MPVNTTARAKSTKITVWNVTASVIAAKLAPTVTLRDRAVVIRAATANGGSKASRLSCMPRPCRIFLVQSCMNIHWQDDPRIVGRNETPVQTPLTDKLCTLGPASLEFIERTEDATVNEVGGEHDEGVRGP